MTSSALLCLILFGVMIVLVLVGIPVYVSILLCSIIGLWILGGQQMVLTQLSSGILTIASSYDYAVIPLFILVGVMAGVTGMAEGTFDAAKTWLGWARGGLLYTVVIANAIFGACSGVSTAGTVVFSKIAAPQLKRQGYDEKITLGCITASSCLSTLIPPSIAILTLCLLANISIGTGLMSGLSAGILMVVLLCVFIFIRARINKKLVPPVTDEDRNITWKQRGRALGLLIPILAVFVLIVLGSFLGWFPATVGGGIASTAIMIYAVVKPNGLNFKQLLNGLREAGTTFAGLFLILVGGTLFSRLVTISGLASGLLSLISNLGVAPWMVFMIVIIFYILCGCVMNCMTIIIITIPIVFPMLTAVGFNPFAVCIILVLLAELGGITPPFGLSVFMVSNVLKISPKKVFGGSWPFLILFLAMVMIGVFFPRIFLWLPALMGAV